uniref:Uncharacterized protein n=1 Tax=Romanomermis culicivorax TaxID=13658 RepID=A0A915J7P9_ROMCU
MRFNISLKPDYSTPSILNVTVQPNQNNAVVEQPGVSRMISEGSLIVLFVKPWLTDDNSGCIIATDFQTINLYERNLHHQHNFVNYPDSQVLILDRYYDWLKNDVIGKKFHFGRLAYTIHGEDSPIPGSKRTFILYA